MKVLVCHDGSKNAQSALERSIKLFRCERPDIILLTVVEDPLDATSVDEESFQKWLAKRDADLKKAADWVAGQGVDVNALLAVGDPRKMILEAVDTKKPDILVIAKRGLSKVEHMVLGSVSAYIVRHSPCPVLVL